MILCRFSFMMAGFLFPLKYSSLWCSQPSLLTNICIHHVGIIKKIINIFNLNK